MKISNYLEDINKNRLFYGRKRRPRFRLFRGVSSLTKEDTKMISNYLENPTKTGIWTLNARWSNFGGVSESVIKNLKAEFEKKEIEIQSGKRKIKLNLKKADRENLIKTTKTFTFIFNLFTYFIHLEKQDESYESFTQYLEDSDEKLIFDLIDLEEIQKEYSNAFEYFKENIYCENFSPVVMSNAIIKLKNGVFILAEDSQEEYFNEDFEDFEEEKEDKEEYKTISLMALNPEPLEQLNLFYEKLNKVSDVNLLPIYSPEEEVFSPYFSFLEQAYESFIYNENIKKLFRKSIDDYEEENYSHCISTIGLILEDYLIQIYETFFRDICPKRMTIGELYDSIENSIQKKFQEKSQPNPEIKPLYDNINDLLKKVLATPSLDTEILKTMRNILTYIKESNAQIQFKIDSIHKKNETISIFPKQIRENIFELIKYRNSISHKSRVPIGNYEALRSVYCCITLIIWWINEKKYIEWKTEPDEILKKCIDRNSSVGV